MMKEYIEKMRDFVSRLEAFHEEMGVFFEGSFIVNVGVPIKTELPLKRKYNKKPKLEKTTSNRSVDTAEVALRMAGGEKKLRYCKNCGKPGHRADNCPEEKKPKVERELVERDDGKVVLAHATNLEPVTEEQYADIKTAKDHELTPKEISDEMEVSIREVNRVLQTYSYENYLSVRG